MKKKTQKVQQEVKAPSENEVQVELLKNQLARTLADYDNLRKRTEEEKGNWIKFATSKFIQNLLPILDTLESAQVHLKDQGLAIAIMQFKELLKEEGLQEVNPKAGDKFDENLMEVTEVIDGEKDGEVAQTVMTGWKFIDGNVVRHARVKVYKKAEKAS